MPVTSFSAMTDAGSNRPCLAAAPATSTGDTPASAISATEYLGGGGGEERREGKKGRGRERKKNKEEEERDTDRQRERWKQRRRRRERGEREGTRGGYRELER